jgi:hypothetical protein
MAFVVGRRPYAAAAVALLMALLSRPVQAQVAEMLRKEVEAMKQQLRQMQEQMKKQQALIEKLSAERGGAPAASAARPSTAAPAETADEERLKKQVTENVLRRIQPNLAAANKTFASQFNPAIGFIIDQVGSYSRKDRGNFEFRSGEIWISASVDPFARGYAILNGTPNGIEVEEAAIVTTSLPYNLTVKGGRFFADFGRLSKSHDHDLPFVNRPIALDEYVGGESQADGFELSYLVPIPQYLTLTAGAYNKIGAENHRIDNTVPRNLSEFSYLGRAATYFNLSDANGLDLGLSYASESTGRRSLSGLDLTYHFLPLSQTQYHGLVWGTEVLWNHEDRSAGVATQGGLDANGIPVSSSPFGRRDAAGLYSYLEGRFSRNLYAGLLGEYVEDVERLGRTTQALSPYVTFWASEFQRLRLQYSRVENPSHVRGNDDRFFLQWTVILGSHVHSFRDR